jgi:hypothetical protein
MIYSNNPSKPPGAEGVEYSSGTAELPDDGFMDQFDTVNPRDLEYQPDLDDWVSGIYTPHPALFPYEAFSQMDIFFYPQDPENGVNLNIDAQHNTSLEQAPDALYQTQAAQDLIHGVATNTDNQHTPGLQQAPYALSQFQDPQSPHNGVCLNEDSPSESLDQLWESLQGSILNNQDLTDLFGFAPDSQFTEWDQSLDTTNQLHNSPNEYTTRFSTKIDPIDNFGTLFPTDNGPVYQSPDPPVEFANPAPTWNSPPPGIEQPPVVQERFPQAPSLSIHTPPDNQHLSADKKVPPAPGREKKRSKVALNKRQANIESIDPSKYYHRLSEAPRSWKPRNDNSTLTFQYDEYGELSVNDKFSPDQIGQYLYDHPLNYDQNDVYDYKNSRLTLWIQVTPADSGRRYPCASSSKCRFADCPIPNNSIRKGFFRVAFDEHTVSGRQIDPYHCAGFVHLFCLEKFCDFPNICQNLTVLPDQRNLPEGKNKMAVTRDHEEMVEVVRTFMQSSQKPTSWDYEQTLCFRLTSKHLELEPKVRKTTRYTRGGNHIALHKGDLDKFVEGEIHKVEQKRKLPKRKREIAEEEEEEDIGKLENEVMRPIKRRWKFR